uniref:LKAAEAR motif containing 1 n=1 Tax=Leptobrachium leishanense TaxID=445787 RepID=A0A8C5WGL8_9ANUR
MGTAENRQKEKTPGKKYFSQADLRKMNPVQRARCLAYDQPGKEVAASLVLTNGRIREHILKSFQEMPQTSRDPEQDKQTKVVGQLKAAEARNRIRLMRFRFQCMRAQELNNLISCQPTARDAIRLEVFLPPRPKTMGPRVLLDRFQRERVEDLLADDRQLQINRIH